VLTVLGNLKWFTLLVDPRSSVRLLIGFVLFFFLAMVVIVTVLCSLECAPYNADLILWETPEEPYEWIKLRNAVGAAARATAEAASRANFKPNIKGPSKAAEEV